jgi:hypothetical protein
LYIVALTNKGEKNFIIKLICGAFGCETKITFLLWIQLERSVLLSTTAIQ